MVSIYYKFGYLIQVSKFFFGSVETYFSTETITIRGIAETKKFQKKKIT